MTETLSSTSIIHGQVLMSFYYLVVDIANHGYQSHNTLGTEWFYLRGSNYQKQLFQFKSWAEVITTCI